MIHFWWMKGLINSNKKEASWVVSGQGINSHKITKCTLNFIEKTWQTLLRHRLCPTSRDNILSPDRTTLIVGIMVGYELDVA